MTFKTATTCFWGFLLMCMNFSAYAQTTADITIKTKDNSSIMMEAKAQLERILADYDLDPWVFTHTVMIEDFVVPHSHPVLTLNTRPAKRGNDIDQLSTFIHEQIHWYVDSKPVAEKKVLDIFKEWWPEVPVGRPNGAKSTYSSYMHLIVCWLEFDAMRHFLGEEKAREYVAETGYYKWIYERVLTDTDRIGDVLDKNGFVIKPESK